MPGQTIATADWRALDRVGEDSCRLARTSGGWMLVGHARFHDADGFAALDYVVRCDDGWHTLSADISGTHEDKTIHLALHREAGEWVLNDEPQPQVSGALDVDLSFTPATNLMPLRRLQDGTEHDLRTRAAWLRYPACELAPLDQVYTFKGRQVLYAARQTGYETELSVDDSGFVTLYPGLWDGEVRHAG
ncbi:hypothetical protein EI983_17780 [Roseovarius faecimaris]|uniref:Glycolipid-binding domain-containing protein n=1 Tax=Roseovarius faecimaris TaxID=2494550 RepID=A0A6I6J5I3_9RHOB|nr:putative glycolipid-binding domain-containing protein [Roseovarius faecimaris]QGY00019.1 hypothetical protein EI983_17780 [Roseovarius faecimaris]